MLLKFVFKYIYCTLCNCDTNNGECGLITLYTATDTNLFDIICIITIYRYRVLPHARFTERVDVFCREIIRCAVSLVFIYFFNYLNGILLRNNLCILSSFYSRRFST